jgi:hypothetical protein
MINVRSLLRHALLLTFAGAMLSGCSTPTEPDQELQVLLRFLEVGSSDAAVADIAYGARGGFSDIAVHGVYLQHCTAKHELVAEHAAGIIDLVWEHAPVANQSCTMDVRWVEYEAIIYYVPAGEYTVRVFMDDESDTPTLETAVEVG